MPIATILCEECSKEYKIKIEHASDLFNVKCPKCKTSDKTYIIESGLCTDSEPIKLGIHTGCRQK